MRNTRPNTQQLPRTRSMPLLLMAGFLIVMGVGLQIVRLTVWQGPTELAEGQSVAVVKEEPVGTKRVQALRNPLEDKNVFENLHEHYPEHKKPQKQAEPELPEKKSVPYFSHNPVWGTHDASVELAVFVDNNCDPCRKKFGTMMNALQPLHDRIRVVMKFAPQLEKEVSAGFFAQMARREGVHATYLQKLLAEDYISADRYFLLLEESGVNLMRQREMMKDDLRIITGDLQKDIAQFKALEKSVENTEGLVVYLNGYRLGKAGLDLDYLESHIQKLLMGQGLF